jgi:dihydroxyacetone kinase-like protein
VGKANFSLQEGEMAMGMGIHGEPGVWNGPLKTAKELAGTAVDAILNDMPLPVGSETGVLINGLGSTPLDELYILYGEVFDILKSKGIKVYRNYIGEFATSMEMAGASISIFNLNDELKSLLDHPVHTPFFSQV